MVGQYPHGIDLHVRNLKWALGGEDRIFIVTVPEIIKEFKLQDDKKVKYIPFEHEGEGSFINFWAGFPDILKTLNIDPKWFLFMEADIWFHQRPGFVPRDKQEVANYLPLQHHYHAIMVDDKVIHPRVWEGGTLIHGDLIRRAIDFGISFSFVKNFFWMKDKSWKEKVGEIKMKYFKEPDTFDELGYYCALVEHTTMKYFDRCVHLRGPESLHRKYPNLYNGCTEADLEGPQKKLPYLCAHAAVAPYYIDGHWQGELDWRKIDTKYKDELMKVRRTAHEWMKPDECDRLYTITNTFQ